jgi:Zn-dependent protease
MESANLKVHGIFTKFKQKVRKNMFPSWKIARLSGINVFIHWTFWLLPAWVILTQRDSAEKLSLWLNLLLLASLFVCVVMHEMGHALTARHFGIGTRSITLCPLGGIAQLERMSQKPWEEFCIAIAGPLVNVVLAAILAVMFVAGLVLDPELVDSAAGHFLAILLALNIMMVLFNLLPAFPMDGGRVLRALLANSMGLLRGTRVAVAVGTIVAVLMGVVGVAWAGNPWLVLIGLFVSWSGHQELRVLEMDERRRLAAEEEEPLPAILVPMPARRATICIWDAQRGEWIRQ